MSSAKQKLDTWTKCRFPLFYVLILSFIVLFYLMDMTQLKFMSVRFMSSMKFNPGESFVVKTAGCRIPVLDPFDKAILKYIHKPAPFNCSIIPALVHSNLTSLYIDHSTVPERYKKYYQDNLECCYQPFWRVDPKVSKADNLYGYGSCAYFDPSVEVNDEFVKVLCKIDNTVIYKDFHSFVPNKREKEVPERDGHSNKTEKLNLLLIGIDSVSRLNFLRQMPLTYKYLKNNLSAIDLLGYNKVGDNTFPNLIPVLTGLSVDELKSLCWATPTAKFDKCPFIWKNFSNAGYLTAYSEDSSWMGLFNYLKSGFQHQPTDYYWRTFNYYAEKEVGHHRYYNSDLCIGPRPTYIVLLDYIMKFVKAMAKKPFFNLSWGCSLTHDSLNFPSLGDKAYESFFKSLHATNILNQTVLVILSDHGIRWGDIRTTHQGQLEERLPFLFFIFPTWFQRKYFSAIMNLKKNTRRLTTPFDLHETIKDLLNLTKILPHNLRLRRPTSTERGISLFSQIPENRTCATAGIEMHWCTCQISTEVSRNDSTVAKVAHFTVEYINTLLNGYKACSTLVLNDIINARLLKTENYLNHNSAIHDYTVIVKTHPGGGMFESTVRSEFTNGAYNHTIPFKLTGTISRINLYGNQSYCVTDFHLKLYCYCS